MEVEIQYFQSSQLKITLTYFNFVIAWTETASLLVATVRAVRWKEHADEAVANLSIIQNAEQFSFRRARATHDPYHIASPLETLLPDQ